MLFDQAGKALCIPCTAHAEPENKNENPWTCLHMPGNAMQPTMPSWDPHSHASYATMDGADLHDYRNDTNLALRWWSACRRNVLPLLFIANLTCLWSAHASFGPDTPCHYARSDIVYALNIY